MTQNKETSDGKLDDFRHEQRTAMYFLIAEKIKAVCVANGYAATLHGSLVNDLDIVVIPWTEEAIPPKIMFVCIHEAIRGYLNQADKLPTEKPHGRLSWTLVADWGAYIDLCIMPTVSESEAN